jgi:PKD repeat protein
MQPTRFLTAAAALAAASLAQTIVIPNGLAAAEGASSTAYPWGRGNAQIRVQYVYDSSHFTAQGVTIPILINRLRYRANGATAVAGYTYGAATVQMSTAAVDYTAPSATFASNHGLDLATVYSGPVTVSTPAGTTPNSYYVDLPITPFLYDPSGGNDLCVDMSHDGVGPTSASGPAHDSFGTGALTSRIYHLTNYLSPTGTTQQNSGVVIELSYTPASGLYAGFAANVTAGPSPLAVQFTDQSFSSDPGGITSWSWDFDGDSIIDSNLQNPSFVYTGCGTYDVTLTVTDTQHAPSTFTRTAYVATDEITASFTHAIVAPPNVFQFTDTTTPAATAWAWDFDGDGITDSTLQNPVVALPICNSATVRLTATRNCRTSQATSTVFSAPATASANLTGGTGTTGASIGNFFDVQITAPDGISVCGLTGLSYTGVGPYVASVYVTPDTYLGKDSTAAAWRLVATGNGFMNGGTTTAPSVNLVPLDEPFYLPAGNYGFAIYHTGVGVNGYLGYTNATNGPFVNPDVTFHPNPTVAPGLSRTALFGGSTFQPRQWNGSFHYTTVGLSGQPGYGVFGHGCAGALGVPGNVATTAPAIGTTMSVELTNLPVNAAFFMLGFSRTAWSLGALPADLTGFGAPGCSLRVSPDAVTLILGVANTATFNLGLPAAPALVGLQLFSQGLALDPAANTLGGVTSDAAALVIGS